MKKPRSDAKLLNLPEEQQAKLAEWLLSGMPYHAAKALVERPAPDGFGLSVSLHALSSFWAEVCAPLLLNRRARAVSTADAVAEEAGRQPGRFDAATIDQLKQKAFELSISPQADPKDVKALFMLVLKARDQTLEERRIELDKDKFEFNAAEACLKHLPQLRQIASQAAASDTEKIQDIRKLLFGTLPA